MPAWAQPLRRSGACSAGSWPGTWRASFVYTSDDAVAFLDIRPLTRGHLLVIPRAHAGRLANLDAGARRPVFRVARGWPSRCAGPGYCAEANLFLADGVRPARKSSTCTCTCSRGPSVTVSGCGPPASPARAGRAGRHRRAHPLGTPAPGYPDPTG